jgi:signal transduction histidine kinase
MDDIHSDEELKRSLQGMHEGSIRLEKLVDDFISLAELRTGESETAYSLRKQPIFQPGHLFCTISQDHKYINSRQDVSIQCKIAENLPPLYGDAETLRGGICRLLEAVAYLCPRDEHQTLMLFAAQIDDEVCCNLVLPPSLLEQEFIDMLLNGDMNSLDTASYAPSLIIAKSYIDLNNGRIQINSPNQINIYFPVHTEPIPQ